MKNNYIKLILFIFILLNFLKIHTVNSDIVNYICVFVSLVLYIKKCYSLSFTILLLCCLTVPIWIIFNNIYYNNILHYPVYSDISTLFSISLIATKLMFTTIRNIRMLGIFPFLYVTCDYLAYTQTLYWGIIILIPIVVIQMFNSQIREIKKKYFLVSFIFLITISLFHFIPSKKVESIAVLKSQWCDVSQKPDKNSFTMDYFYAYSDFYTVLNSYAKTEIITNKDIQNNQLNYDSIVLITPTTYFSEIEIQNLSNFVFYGGKLIIIADHTNLYGHADNLNPLLSVFGAKLNDDTLYDDLDYYKKYHININSLLLTKTYTKTNSSLLLPIHANIWAISDKIISEKADYTKDNFFGSLDFTEDDTVGSFPVGATIQWGLGKVIIWTDSTLFSNFALSQKYHLYLLDYLITQNIINDNDRSVPYKKVNIVANEKMLREAPPNHLPKDDHFSTLIANQTRYNILPVYNADNIEIPQLLFLKYADFLKKSKMLEKKMHIVLVDDIPENNVFNVKRYDIHTHKEVNICQNNCFYSVNGNDITVNYKNSTVLFGKNVISDRELGTWWNTITISPYKKYMIEKFNQWLCYNENISFFDYPKTEKKFHNISFSYDNGKKEYLKEINISKKQHFYDNDWVYLDNRRWGILLNDNKIIGGPETIDAITNVKDMQKWIIKY